MDITSPEVLAKQEARKARFGISNDSKKRHRSKEDNDEEDEKDDGAAIMEVHVEPLPTTQAWDNEEFVREHRVEPPLSLFVNLPPEEEKREETEEFTLDDSAKVTSLLQEKIHLFDIDWAAFKQI
jgi:hypothetical protein